MRIDVGRLRRLETSAVQKKGADLAPFFVSGGRR